MVWEKAVRLMENGYTLEEPEDKNLKGDMPGDIVNIVSGHIKKAEVLFPEVLKKIAGLKDRKKVVISVSGGSGVGKTGIALMLSWYLSQNGINAYTLSGDNYPRRIPEYNDAERRLVFTDAGINRLVAENLYTDEVTRLLMEHRKQGSDADPGLAGKYPWIKEYQKAGREALEKYLGTENELKFGELSAVLGNFKSGARDIWLRRMGRKEYEIWYEKKDSSDIEILVLEWTHGNSPYLKGCDISVVLYSTPGSTLANRKKRNRDKNTDSPFTMMVLEIEQEKINQGLGRADILLDENAKIMKDYHV